MTCNSDHCHCPACNAKRAKTHVKTDFPSYRDRCYYSHGIEGYWKWMRLAHGWRKISIRDHTLFGPYYERVEFTSTGFRAYRDGTIEHHSWPPNRIREMRESVAWRKMMGEDVSYDDEMRRARREKIDRHARQGRVFSTLNHDGKRIQWVWEKQPNGGWQKKDIWSRQLFGPVVFNESTRARIAEKMARLGEHGVKGGEGVIGALASLREYMGKDVRRRVVEETTTLTAGDLSKTTKVVYESNPYSKSSAWVRERFTTPPCHPFTGSREFREAYEGSFPEWTTHLKPEDPTMLSYLRLSLLLWRSAHPTSHPYPMNHDTTGSTRMALRQLERDNLITFVGEDMAYKLTDRAIVLIEAIKALPMPVQQPSPWVMPANGGLL